MASRLNAYRRGRGAPADGGSLPPPGDDEPEARRGLGLLCAVGAGAGAAVGLVGGAFRWLLLRADTGRTALLHWAHHWPAAGWIAPVALVAAGAAAARYLVRFAPLASGSGVQDVEAVWRGEAEPPLRVLPVKFAGGLAGIGSGLALGREGPTVHMGAVIAAAAGRPLGLDRDDRRILQAALGGAGLGVAFNAPAAGMLFSFEEVARSFRPRLTLVTLIGSATAITCSRLILGNRPDFLVGPVAAPAGWLIAVYVAFGAVTGVFGVAYNHLILRGLDLFGRFRRYPAELRAAAVGGVMGLLLWFAPLGAGGGDVLAQRVLGGAIGTGALAWYFLARFLAGPWSYSAGAPGGLFAPLLAVGAVWGALIHRLAEPLLPALGAQPQALAIVGMSTFFAAVVRAPVTGIILIAEMTATTTLLVPMLAAAFAAVLVATLLRNEPIYDSLRARMHQHRPAVPPDHTLQGRRLRRPPGTHVTAAGPA